MLVCWRTLPNNVVISKYLSYENSVLSASSSVMTPSHIDLWDIADSDADDRNTPAESTDGVPQGKEMACFYREVCRTMLP